MSKDLKLAQFALNIEIVNILTFTLYSEADRKVENIQLKCE